MFQLSKMNECKYPSISVSVIFSLGPLINYAHSSFKTPVYIGTDMYKWCANVAERTHCRRVFKKSSRLSSDHKLDVHPRALAFILLLLEFPFLVSLCLFTVVFVVPDPRHGIFDQ